MVVDAQLQDQLARIATLQDVTYELPELKSDVSSSDFNLLVYISGIDPDNGEEVFEELVCPVLVDASVEDNGIGSYEFWGAKGNDVQMGWVIDKLQFETPWPPALAGKADAILEEVGDAIAEMDVPDKDDEDYFDEPDFDHEDW
jgi:hypothetical protein